MQYTILLFYYRRKQYSFYSYMILQLKVQFDYEISRHTYEISVDSEIFSSKLITCLSHPKNVA
jgi:hypothetical protein